MLVVGPRPVAPSPSPLPPGAFGSEARERLAALDADHFWNASRRELVVRLLVRHRATSPVLDLGCGTGSTVADLRARGLIAYGLDAAGSVDLHADVARLPIRDGSIGCVLLLDVIEHLDAVTVLRAARRILRPGGLLLLTVPAHPWLWSERDERAGHLRRYTKPVLIDTLARAGFAVERIRGFQLALLPLAALSRAAARRRPQLLAVEDRPPAIVHRVLRGVLHAEVRMSGVVPIPTGTSYVAVARPT